MKYTYDYVAYVADDGNYGVESVLTFDFEDFANKYNGVWEMLDEVSDRDRAEFVLAIIDQDEEALRGFAEEYELPLDKLLD